MANEAKNMGESIRVRVPPPNPQSSSSSLPPPPPNPRTRCTHSTDCCSVKFMVQNYSNFSRSAAPARLMYYQNYSWLDFSSMVLQKAQSSFLEGKAIFEVSIEDSKHIFDFMRMLDIDTMTWNQRSISWIDENGKCFFPKMFVGCEFENFKDKSDSSEIEIEIKIDD